MGDVQGPEPPGWQIDEGTARWSEGGSQIGGKVTRRWSERGGGVGGWE